MWLLYNKNKPVRFSTSNAIIVLILANTNKKAEKKTLSLVWLGNDDELFSSVLQAERERCLMWRGPH